MIKLNIYNKLECVFFLINMLIFKYIHILLFILICSIENDKKKRKGQKKENRNNVKGC